MDNRNAKTGVAVAPRQKMRSNGLWLLAAIMVALFAGLSQPLSVYADPGDLDTSFSTDGKQTTDFFAGIDGARAVVMQSDGKIVVGGFATTIDGEVDFALARYNV